MANRKAEADCTKVERDILEVGHNIQDLVSESRKDKIYTWLPPPDPSTNYNKAVQQRQEGTGLWLMRSNQFCLWLTKQNSFLWLYGIPGCGKTILSSTIIDYVEKTYPDQLLLYFYFDFNDSSKQTLGNVVLSLIFQLYSKCKDTQGLLESFISACEVTQKTPTPAKLCEVFFQMIAQTKEVYIILDALDECVTRKGPEGLLSWIQRLLRWKEKNVHLLVTSRPEHDIVLELRNLTQGDENMVNLKSDLINNDIRSYIHNRVREDNGLTRWKSRPDVLDEVEMRLMEKANGMQVYLNHCTYVPSFANKRQVPMGCMPNRCFGRMSESTFIGGCSCLTSSDVR